MQKSKSYTAADRLVDDRETMHDQLLSNSTRGQQPQLRSRIVGSPSDIASEFSPIGSQVFLAYKTHRFERSATNRLMSGRYQ